MHFHLIINFDWDYGWNIYSMLRYINQKLISLMPKLRTRCIIVIIIAISKRIITFLSSFIIIFTEIPLTIGDPSSYRFRIFMRFEWKNFSSNWILPFVNMHAVTSRKKIMIFKSTRVCDTRGNDLLIASPIETLESLKIIERTI